MGPAPSGHNGRMPGPNHDVDAIVVGAGHNGLVAAAYLARAGRSTLLLEARADVGGTATSEAFAGAMVNVCSCDHVTFRTTPVIGELDLERHGLEYIEIDPAGAAVAWTDDPNAVNPLVTWRDPEQTLDHLASQHPADLDGYRTYLRHAMPAVRMILDVATEPPTVRGLARAGLRRRFAGVPTVFRWSRRSAADVMRSYFSSDVLRGAAMVGGPMVWGISPETPGTGLGALGYAMRHVAHVGRPVGGSGRLPLALRRAFEEHGGTVRTGAKVAAILCDTDAVTGVRLEDGTEITAPVVVSAADPRRTFVEWLKNPPAGAAALVERWERATPEDGYESKIDAVLTEAPVVRGVDTSLASTLTLVPTLAEMDEAARLMASGGVIRRPGMFVNVPSLVDPTLAPPGRHVFSLEVLLTPYSHPGGWEASDEPQRWLELVAARCENDFLGSIEARRVMTPEVYEREFQLPRGHATSFAGGPLAALRNDDPELTHYETAVPGLYLTGAATFPGAGIWGASGRNCATVVLAQTA